MSKGRKITIGFIIGAVIIIAGFDLWAVLAHGGEATISTVLYDAASDYPVVSFVLGFVFGHIFWPNR